MKPLNEMPRTAAAGVKAVLLDIDDTLTTDGRLEAAAYSALERLQGAGLAVVPVTGRPAGWCDMIARFWPVDGVVGENGAFYYSYDRETRVMHRVHAASDAERRANRDRLDTLSKQILEQVPGCAISADQAFRVADLAIDFCEDVSPLSNAAINRIVAIFETAGATAKVSSIHVNGWFGSYDKLAMSRRFLAEVLGVAPAAAAGCVVFIGDSPNDEPMFSAFPLSVGVANVADQIERIRHRPAFVAQGRSGAGFVEFTEILIAARR